MHTQTAKAMTPDALVRETFQAIFRGETEPYQEHPGLHALATAMPAMRTGLPDFSAELVQQLVDGDRVASHWIFRGTHRGTLHGIPATGRPVQFQNISICRVVDGRIVQYNSEIGWLALLTQIGAWPPRL